MYVFSAYLLSSWHADVHALATFQPKACWAGGRRPLRSTLFWKWRRSLLPPARRIVTALQSLTTFPVTNHSQTPRQPGPQTMQAPPTCCLAIQARRDVGVGHALKTEMAHVATQRSARPGRQSGRVWTSNLPMWRKRVACSSLSWPQQHGRMCARGPTLRPPQSLLACA